jgi:hypothetical protein
MNAWDNLPNAKHIDAILAHVKAHPQAWDAAWVAARGAAWVAARVAARDAARDAAEDAGRYAGRYAILAHAKAPSQAWGAVRDAVLALVAWDDASEVLAMPVDAVKLLASCSDHRAVLLLPAVMAMDVTTK